MKNYKEDFEVALEETLDKIGGSALIREGMAYAALGGGKRLRPQLLFMSLELLGKQPSLGFASAVALEMIHNYSLVHDDLPAMDNDDYRRGRLTTHKKYGEAEAILIGDALLTHAFGVLVDGNEGKIPAKANLELVSLFAKHAGNSGMIGGQALDLASEGQKISLEDLQRIHEEKTGKLLLLAFQTAAILGEASPEERAALETVGKKIGLAFQIKDDLLDVEGNFEELGKAVGSDAKAEKATYPKYLGLEASKKLLAEQLAEARESLQAVFPEENLGDFMELLDYMEKRKQ